MNIVGYDDDDDNDEGDDIRNEIAVETPLNPSKKQKTSAVSTSTSTSIPSTSPLPSVSSLLPLISSPSLGNDRTMPFQFTNEYGKERFVGDFVTLSYVQLEPPTSDQRLLWSQWSSQLQANVTTGTSHSQSNAPQLNWIADERLHVSLSRAHTIREHHIEPLVAALRNALTQCISKWHSKQKQSPLSAVEASFDRLRWLNNEERTRRFATFMLSPHIGDAYNRILSLIEAVDEVMVQFRLAKFFENPLPHVSVAWFSTTETEPMQTTKSSDGGSGGGVASQLTTTSSTSSTDERPLSEPWQTRFRGIYCSSGNRSFKLI
jgi:hypothetical protein